MSEITHEDLAAALDRIAMTPDGGLLYAYLQKMAIALPEGDDPTDSALRADFGRRSLAHRMMGLMARGIDESGGRTDDSTGLGKRSDRPVVFLTSKPANVGARESPRAFIARTGGDDPGAA